MRAHGFRVYFTPLPEVLFTFPSRYSSTVGLPVVFSLAGWSPRFRAGFLVSCATQVAASASGARFAYGALTLSGRRFHAVRLRCRKPFPAAPTTPVSFPAGTEMFQFPALAPPSRRRPPIGTGYPIRTSADRAVFAGPRGFSQLVTSFLASGSHRHPPCALFRFPFSFIYL